mmetsp:Transcript_5287/g.16783  ORF Transcript_5287/g.16783 Transcript_5287/m.16783 type:complete len:435 (-) Transcript_5287:1319-2623(-)
MRAQACAGSMRPRGRRHKSGATRQAVRPGRLRVDKQEIAVVVEGEGPTSLGGEVAVASSFNARAGQLGLSHRQRRHVHALLRHGVHGVVRVHGRRVVLGHEDGVLVAAAPEHLVFDAREHAVLHRQLLQLPGALRVRCQAVDDRLLLLDVGGLGLGRGLGFGNTDGVDAAKSGLPGLFDAILGVVFQRRHGRPVVLGFHLLARYGGAVAHQLIRALKRRDDDVGPAHFQRFVHVVGRGGQHDAGVRRMKGDAARRTRDHLGGPEAVAGSELAHHLPLPRAAVRRDELQRAPHDEEVVGRHSVLPRKRCAFANVLRAQARNQRGGGLVREKVKHLGAAEFVGRGPWNCRFDHPGVLCAKTVFEPVAVHDADHVRSGDRPPFEVRDGGRHRLGAEVRRLDGNDRRCSQRLPRGDTAQQLLLCKQPEETPLDVDNAR